MYELKFDCVSSAESLNRRFECLLKILSKNECNDLAVVRSDERKQAVCKSVREFFDKSSELIPKANLYIFGGVLRDLSLSGPENFKSDIDVVVDGRWIDLLPFLSELGAVKNKFGGYRLIVAGTPIDIWKADRTWAVQVGLVKYEGIESLLNTTILNWDAILMSWKTREVICSEDYFYEIRERALNIVRHENPNPSGMAVRVFRHFIMKDAVKAHISAYRYLENTTKDFSFQELKNCELKSYKESVIKYKHYKFFEMARKFAHSDYCDADFLKNII